MLGDDKAPHDFLILFFLFFYIVFVVVFFSLNMSVGKQNIHVFKINQLCRLILFFI